jgi:hypothetical protein
MREEGVVSLDAERNENKRPVDVYLGARGERGREINAMRAALAQGRCV